MPDYAKKIVYLSEAQYQDLLTNQTLTVNGTTINYDENTIYMTPQNTPLYATDLADWAKAANKPTYTAQEVGALPANTVIPEVPIQDVQVNGTSIAANGVANIPIASRDRTGAIALGYGFKVDSSTNRLMLTPADVGDTRLANGGVYALTPSVEHGATFFGLAKAAGDTTQSQQGNVVGTYTPEAKGAIQQMLGVSDLIATAENSLVASKAYAIGDVFTANGKLYKATAAIAADAAIIPEVEGEEVSGANCVETKVGEGFVKFTDVASSTNYGVVKLSDSLGIYNYNGVLAIKGATSAEIKRGTPSFIAPTILRQHESTFYGLAKAAGADEKDSTLPVGQYTDTAKAAINTMIGSVSKESLKNAGISAQTYTEKFSGEFTVTTATTSGWLNPYARASVTGRISKHYMHRVTFNGTEYILPTRMWYSASNGNIKVYEYLGNLGLYISDISGVPEGTDNVPFVIISDLNDSSSIDVLTQNAGTYTILVEQINNTQTELPKSLIWGDSYVPIEKNNNGGTYNGFSIGVNELKNQRGTFAFGYGNRIDNEFGFALGEGNILKCSSSYVEGSGNEVTAFNSMAHSNHVEGYLNKFTKLGICNHIEGMDNKSNRILLSNTHIEGASNEANGNFIHIEGLGNIANGEQSHIEGTHNIGNGYNIHVQGCYNIADTIAPEWVANTEYSIGDYIYKSYVNSSTPYGSFICIENNNDAVFTSSKWKQITGSQCSDALMLIGNGLSKTDRSNALKVDWIGNMYLGGNVYVNANADSTGGTKIATVEDIPDIQVNGTSIVSNGVANIPMIGYDHLGVAKLDQYSTYGIGMREDGNLQIVGASDSQYKASNSERRPVVPTKQHMSVFYGLAKAAGDTTMASSTNAVGTYTDNAKASIKSMLGIVDGSTGTVDVSGTTPTITAVENTRYVCGEVTSLDFTPAVSGICIVRFTSGSTVTVLTLPSTVKFPEWFDPTSLETNTIYEICVTDGVYGAVMSWAQ